MAVVPREPKPPWNLDWLFCCCCLCMNEGTWVIISEEVLPFYAIYPDVVAGVYPENR